MQSIITLERDGVCTPSQRLLMDVATAGNENITDGINIPVQQFTHWEET